VHGVEAALAAFWNVAANEGDIEKLVCQAGFTFAQISKKPFTLKKKPQHFYLTNYADLSCIN
jgi:hypothetical protein